MTIPFLGYFKKKETKGPATPAPMSLRPARPKQDGDRMSKTVMPNTTQTLSGQNESGAVATMVAPATQAGRATVAFGGQNTTRRVSDLPRAVALALEPRVERTISLELQDVVSQMPEGLVRPLENAFAVRKVLLKASEVERGMAAGKPSISIWTIYQQVPEIFLRKIPSDDATEVGLPFEKVMEQFRKLQVRADQGREQAVPHVETPFLKVTLEDDERFGTVTKIPQPGESELPPVRMELATAETLAAAQPEATAGERFVVTALPSMHFPASANDNGAAKGSAGNPIPLSPKGTGAPASERVPASSGPSVPTKAGARIPFKVSTSSDEAPPKEPWLTKENFAGEEVPAAAAQVKISLLILPILRGVLPEQIKGDVSSVPDDARMEIPFCLIEPQLATGRIALPAKEFADYLPENHREIFDVQAVDAPVSLPLPEVLKNLPGATLRVRADQTEQELSETFETPFSARAEEDAKRFQVPAGPIAKAAVTSPVAAAPQPPKVAPAPQPAPAAAPIPVAKAEAPAPAVKPKVTPKAVQHAGEEFDAKAAVARAATLPGVKGCAIMFGDGLALAGNMPAKYGVDGLCAMAPSFFRKVENHLTETTLGLLETVTLACPKESMTLFVHDNLCLAALHEKEALTPEIRDRLARVLLELSRKYSNPA